MYEDFPTWVTETIYGRDEVYNSSYVKWENMGNSPSFTLHFAGLFFHTSLTIPQAATTFPSPFHNLSHQEPIFSAPNK